MLHQEQYVRLLDALPALQQADPPLLEAVRNAAFFTRIPAGHDLFVTDDEVDAIAVVISGTVRVYQISTLR